MNNYSSWQIGPNDFPFRDNLDEQIKFICRYGILAPSVHNTQPWRIKIGGGKLAITPALDRQLRFGDQTGRQMWISLGCYLENVVMAGQAFGILVTSVDLAAGSIKVSFERASSTGSLDLAAAMVNRVSNRADFEPKEVSRADLDKIAASWESDRVKIYTTSDSATIRLVADLTARGIELALSIPDFKIELVHLFRSNWTKMGDGMPGFVLGKGGLRSLVESIRFRLTSVAKAEAAKEHNLIMKSAALVMTFSRGDTTEFWLEAGRAYERAAVTATMLGLSQSTVAAAVEAPDFHQEIEAKLKTRDRLQTVMRLGYSRKLAPHSPRRGLDEIIT